MGGSYDKSFNAYKHHTLIVTFPLVTFRILKPTVGIISSVNSPDCKKTLNY